MATCRGGLCPAVEVVRLIIYDDNMKSCICLIVFLCKNTLTCSIVSNNYYFIFILLYKNMTHILCVTFYVTHKIYFMCHIKYILNYDSIHFRLDQRVDRAYARGIILLEKRIMILYFLNYIL